MQIDIQSRDFSPTDALRGHAERRLPPGLPRVFMANTVSLLPGTLSVELGSNCLKIHVLDGRKGLSSEIGAVEQAVARVFGVSLR